MKRIMILALIALMMMALTNTVGAEVSIDLNNNYSVFDGFESSRNSLDFGPMPNKEEPLGIDLDDDGYDDSFVICRNGRYRCAGGYNDLYGKVTLSNGEPINGVEDGYMGANSIYFQLHNDTGAAINLYTYYYSVGGMKIYDDYTEYSTNETAGLEGEDIKIFIKGDPTKDGSYGGWTVIDDSFIIYGSNYSYVCPTEKNYQNDTWSEWQGTYCDGAFNSQSRFRTQTDLNGCRDSTTTVFWEYRELACGGLGDSGIADKGVAGNPVYFMPLDDGDHTDNKGVLTSYSDTALQVPNRDELANMAIDGDIGYTGHTGPGDIAFDFWFKSDQQEAGRGKLVGATTRFAVTNNRGGYAGVYHTLNNDNTMTFEMVRKNAYGEWSATQQDVTLNFSETPGDMSKTYYDGVWHHVTSSYNNATGEMLIILDGEYKVTSAEAPGYNWFQPGGDRGDPHFWTRGSMDQWNTLDQCAGLCEAGWITPGSSAYAQVDMIRVYDQPLGDDESQYLLECYDDCEPIICEVALPEKECYVPAGTNLELAAGIYNNVSITLDGAATLTTSGALISGDIYLAGDSNLVISAGDVLDATIHITEDFAGTITYAENGASPSTLVIDNPNNYSFSLSYEETSPVIAGIYFEDVAIPSTTIVTTTFDTDTNTADLDILTNPELDIQARLFFDGLAVAGTEYDIYTNGVLAVEGVDFDYLAGTDGDSLEITVYHWSTWSFKRPEYVGLYILASDSSLLTTPKTESMVGENYTLVYGVHSGSTETVTCDIAWNGNLLVKEYTGTNYGADIIDYTLLTGFEPVSNTTVEVTCSNSFTVSDSIRVERTDNPDPCLPINRTIDYDENKVIFESACIEVTLPMQHQQNAISMMNKLTGESFKLHFDALYEKDKKTKATLKVNPVLNNIPFESMGDTSITYANGDISMTYIVLSDHVKIVGTLSNYLVEMPNADIWMKYGYTGKGSLYFPPQLLPGGNVIDAPIDYTFEDGQKFAYEKIMSTTFTLFDPVYTSSEAGGTGGASGAWPDAEDIAEGMKAEGEDLEASFRKSGSDTGGSFLSIGGQGNTWNIKEMFGNTEWLGNMWQRMKGFFVNE